MIVSHSCKTITPSTNNTPYHNTQVMKESATLAMTWLKAQMGGNGNGNGSNGGNGVLERLVGRPQAVLDSRTDVHIHVPAGAIPKVG